MNRENQKINIYIYININKIFWWQLIYRNNPTAMKKNIYERQSHRYGDDNSTATLTLVGNITLKEI